MYKAVITDLDGTLLNDEHVVSEYSKKVIKKLIEKGIKFFIATGRLHASTKEIADSIGVKIPLVTINGTRVLDEDGNELFNSCLDLDIVKKIASIDYKSCGEDILINGYDKDLWLIVDKRAEEYYRKKRPDKPYFPTTVSQEYFISRKYNKMFFIGEHENLLKLKELLKKEIDYPLNMDFVGQRTLEIFKTEANKALGSKILLEREGLTLDDAIAFGDSLNDYIMLEAVKKGFIMGNGLYLLKEKAPHLEIIGNNFEDGEAKKLVEIFDLEIED